MSEKISLDSSAVDNKTLQGKQDTGFLCRKTVYFNKIYVRYYKEDQRTDGS